MVLNDKLFILRRLLQTCRQFHSSRIKKIYDGSNKITVNIINNKEEKSFLVNKCLPVGFKLNDDSIVLGPLAILPKTILSWNVGSTKDINEATLSLFTVLYPPLDLLVLGLETNYEYKKILELRKILMKYNIKAEILTVQQACGVYNFLVSEGRYVAAGLIPPVIKKPLILEKLTKLSDEKKQIETK